MNYNGIEKELRASITSIEIPNDVTSISWDAFVGCDNLQYNVYGNGLYLGNKENAYFVLVKASSRDIRSCQVNRGTKIINHCAFKYCRNLERVELPDGIINMGTGVFLDCLKLKSISIPNTIKTFDVGVFNGSGLTSFEIPTSVTSIGNAAFAGCKGLTNIFIPSSVTSIDRFAFLNCDNLTIYCESKSQPSGWHDDWNISNRPVVWRYKL